ncbi:hypothetical protein [Streptomyces spectabilis]|uniref:Uncharacterized protein n=1 Tax=Streptomyces spectabilis TaxID=68270 RepID=A0A5P2X465_STRST|nr:hypothetical protein [Streptomyces spectabilis]MBB5103286.1 hypothetical protein [Streptomyces spectabilis]MCI3902476.1 hypothetical protein [Streptomyces spectabilis]QEV59813.1 hypothetical protein CP982_14580 [Streptomyces spectabilis]GGV13624.1 hypothetical protein GCM10010245_23780 [Streptomyces spectabilis]
MHAPLPTHPRTGARALGWRKARPGEDDDALYPVWPILGGAEDEDGQDDDTDDDTDEGADDDGGQDDDTADGGDQDDADPEGADQLGDRGKRALAAMKGKWKSERDKRRALETRMAEQGQDDDAVTKATAAATAAANTRILKAEVRAAAKGRLADPKDALTFLDLEQFEVDEDGAIDEDEIAEAIETLLKKKPYLAAQSGRRFQGTGDGGAARKAGRPKQLGEKDLKNMSADDIVKAQDAGQLDDYLGAG